MTDYIQALILTFIEALCCTLFFDTFFEKRFLDKKRRLQRWIHKTLLSVLCLLFVGISLICGERYIIKAILAVAAIYFIMQCMYNGKGLQILFLSVVYYGVVLLVDRVLFIFVLYVLNVSEEEFWNNPVRATIIALLAKNVLFLCILFLKRRYKSRGDFALVSNKEWILFLCFPMITIVCMIAFAVERETMGKDVLIVSFSLIFLNFLVFFMIQNIVKYEREKQETQLFHERTKNQIAMYRYMEEVYAEQRKKMHDFKNHMTCVQGLLVNNANREAIEYLRTVNDNWMDELDYINTNHVIVNSILNQKYKLARAKGIAMILSVNDLQGIQINDEDIVTVLSNLLDNAIEACEKVTEKPKNIRVRVWHEENRTIISTKNPIDKPIKIQEGRIYSTKRNERMQGIGLLNIKNVVEKYDGEDIYSCSDGYFTHSVIIEKTTKTVVV